MRKISAMYEWSGGTDYRHTCKECQNCIQIAKGKRTVHKCLSYGKSDSSATDWNAANIACRAFGKKPPKVPVFYSDFEKSRQDDQLEGQMDIFDFIPMEG